MVVHSFNPSTLEGEVALCEFEANLAYRESSRTARATQRNPVSKKNKNKNKTQLVACYSCGGGAFQEFYTTRFTLRSAVVK